jgi:hypothetical protein
VIIYTQFTGDFLWVFGWFDLLLSLLLSFPARPYVEATPKTIMRVMGVKGLTLYHLKSHLQVRTYIAAGSHACKD